MTSTAISAPSVGDEGSVDMTVGREHLASAFAENRSEAYPDVLATPALISLLERACAAVLQPALQPGQMSVGVRVNVTHKAPTPVGRPVTARARYLRQEGRQYVFDVTAEDAGGIVATGEHTRAIVDSTQVLQAAAQRFAKAEATSQK